MNRSDILKKICIGLTLCVFALSGAYYAAFSYVKNANKEISALTNELSMETRKKQESVSAETLIVSADPDLALIEEAIVPRDGDVAFIEMIEALARDNKLSVEIESLSIEPVDKKDGPIVYLVIRLKTKGGWDSTHTYLSLIESLPQEILVKNLGLSAEKDTSGEKEGDVYTGMWQSRLDMRVLKYK